MCVVYVVHVVYVERVCFLENIHAHNILINKNISAESS